MAEVCYGCEGPLGVVRHRVGEASDKGVDVEWCDKCWSEHHPSIGTIMRRFKVGDEPAAASVALHEEPTESAEPVKEERAYPYVSSPLVAAEVLDLSNSWAGTLELCLSSWTDGACSFTLTGAEGARHWGGHVDEILELLLKMVFAVATHRELIHVAQEHTGKSVPALSAVRAAAGECNAQDSMAIYRDDQLRWLIAPAGAEQLRVQHFTDTVTVTGLIERFATVSELSRVMLQIMRHRPTNYEPLTTAAPR